ncbi:hypothetical protein GCM10010170_068670 [Dactylosporangium salmoneum]|uniref:Uncharacterized protein n=1 Tax=Dactylosporangium salmoneum TaxID=53361 RepID=A0ABP5U6T3_9ACTN
MERVKGIETLTVSLGTVQVTLPRRMNLQIAPAASGLERPANTWVNGPLMARMRLGTDNRHHQDKLTVSG